MPRLVTSSYVPVGVYVGELIKPKPGNLSADARLVNYIGRGSRLALASNQPIRRSFVYAEELSFSTIAPHKADLMYHADGNKEAPIKLFKNDGTEVRSDQWAFVKVGDEFTQVLINTDVFDQTATYKLDYQAVAREVLDPLPVTGLRQIKQVGNQQDQPQYNEYVDYFIHASLTTPDASAVHDIPEVGSLSFTGSGTGSVAFDISNEYAHNYNRKYELDVVATGASVTFEWSSTPMCGGNYSAPSVPLHSVEAKPQVTTGAGVVSLEYGLKLLVGSVTSFQLGDHYEFWAFGPALVEIDKRHNATNQYSYSSAIVPTVTGTGSVSYAADSLYSGEFNANFQIKVASVLGTVVTFAWAKYGESYINGSFAVDSTVPASLKQSIYEGIKLVFASVASFVVGDKYSFEVKAPRIFATAKDSREYTLNAGITSEGSSFGTLAGDFITNTPEGRFGEFLADSSVKSGHVVLPDNLNLAFRNLFKNRFTTGDKFTFTFADEELLDWSLTKKLEESKESTEILHDITGGVTGVANNYYIVLKYTPMAGTIVVKKQSDSSVIASTLIAGTPFIAFGAVSPSTAMIITYEFKGLEPDPGQLYYFTALYLRPTEFYNTPTLILDKDDGRALLAPSSADNHLYIMNELAFENGAPGLYVSQAKDADDDGVYTDVDFKEAILASEHVSRITDQVVLSNFTSTSDLLAVNIWGNDPFEKREQLAWFGMPVGTEIGDIDSPDTIVYTARRTLQVYGNSPAHGTRILVAPTWCTRTIVLENNVSKQVTLDGSFVAGALAALNASFADPAETVLRKQLAGFDTMQVYTDPENRILGGASTIYLSDLGAKVFQMQEDLTVDTMASEFNLISAMNQKQFVTKVVRREMDSSLISLVVPSAQAGIGLVRATLAGILLGLLGRGLIAQFQDANKNDRRFDPNADIVVYQDTEDETLYHFLYAYWLRYPIKRLFGLYSVGTNDFGANQE